MMIVQTMGPPVVASRCVPLYSDQPCGDAAAAIALPDADTLLLVLVDGLGHGAPAAQAADAALAWLGVQPSRPLPELIMGLDAALRETRGAAIGLAQLAWRGPVVGISYAGIGNTRMMRWRDTQLHRLPSQYGIVGGGLAHPPMVGWTDLQPGDWVLMFSDGIDEALQLPAVLPEWERDPARLCAHLLARWRSSIDDAGVLVCHLPATGAGR